MNEKEFLAGLADQPLHKRYLGYLKLSGPGWLQSAITLGGGSLAGSLYLGVLSGFSLLWLQPLAMIFGIIMLSAIGYVTLSTGERPFAAVNKHVNPVLGWGWAIATLMANMVWALPQFSLATGAVQQNLLPGVLGAESAMGAEHGKLIIVIVILAISITITWLYDSGGWGIKFYEGLLKVLVGLIVLCFFGVVIKMSLTDIGLNWGAIGRGFIPDFGLWTHPTPSFQSILSEVGDGARPFWTHRILSEQRDVMIGSVATAVGINMTFFMGYAMLAKGWDKDYRGLAIFDLSTGMMIPYLLATSCVVIASSAQFHARPSPGLLGEKGSNGAILEPAPNLVGPFNGILEARLKNKLGDGAWNSLTDEDKARRKRDLPETERSLAAMLVRRDASNLARSLQPLTGDLFANIIFGVGVVGMGLSTITILMLISGFVICEMLGVPPRGWPHRLGCLAGGVGALGPFIWNSDARFWLAVPTSVFGMVLLPIAYVSFFLLMNQKSLLGEHMPRGGVRWIWNTLLLLATLFATFGAYSSIASREAVMAGVAVKYWGFGAFGLFIFLALVAHLRRKPATTV